MAKKAINRRAPRNAMYTVQDSQGKVVYRIDQAPQCPHKLFTSGQRCQGVAGHTGHHWQYAPDGSLHQDANKKDKKRGHFGASQTPPGHANYIAPQEKVADCFRWKSKLVRIRDAKLCKRLAAGKIRSGESVSRPVELVEKHG